MSKRQLCPWCDTEIVWDEEFGPEDTCPHCSNELRDYNTVSLSLNSSEEEESGYSDDDDYGEIAEAYTDEAARGADCTYCGEETIIVGQKLIREDEFIPRKSKQSNRTFLQAPFTMDAAMCPACMQMSFSLSDESRKVMEKRWKTER